MPLLSQPDDTPNLGGMSTTSCFRSDKHYQTACRGSPLVNPLTAILLPTAGAIMATICLVLKLVQTGFTWISRITLVENSMF